MELGTALSWAAAIISILLIRKRLKDKAAILIFLSSFLLFRLLTTKSLFPFYYQLPEFVNASIRILVYTTFLLPFYILLQKAYRLAFNH